MNGRLAALIAALALAGCSAQSAPTAPPGGTEAAQSDARHLLTALTDPPQQGPLAPRDECAKLPGADAFREQLADAVLAQDAQRFAALAAPDITLDYGGGAGRQELMARLSQPDAKLWSQLLQILPLGCAANHDDALVMPGFFLTDPGNRDPYALALVLGEGVKLRKQGRADGDVLQDLSWNLVDMVDSGDEESAFRQVRTAEGIEGYVEAAKLRSLLDYRLLAQRGDNGWQLTAFVAGD